MLWRLLIAGLSVTGGAAGAEVRHDPLKDAHPPGAYDFSGRATVVDGDTLNVEAGLQSDGSPRIMRTRLMGVDAPAYPTTDGVRARDVLRTLVPEGWSVYCSCETLGERSGRCRQDHYGRTLAVCATTRSGDLGKHMVQQGWARARYDCRYVADEREAQAAGRGLWPGLRDIPAKCK